MRNQQEVVHSLMQEEPLILGLARQVSAIGSTIAITHTIILLKILVCTPNRVPTARVV